MTEIGGIVVWSYLEGAGSVARSTICANQLGVFVRKLISLFVSVLISYATVQTLLS